MRPIQRLDVEEPTPGRSGRSSGRPYSPCCPPRGTDARDLRRACDERTAVFDADIEVPTGDGPMRWSVCHAGDHVPRPLVVLYPDMWGLREEMRDLARRLATGGWYCAVPDVFHRETGAALVQPVDEHGRTVSAERMTEGLAPALERLGRLSDTHVLADTAALLDHLAGDPAVDVQRFGAIGWCMGGRHAVEAAARWSGRLLATACLHGSFLVSDRPESPHLVLDRLRGELYCSYADEDFTAPPAMVAQWEQLLAAAPVRYQGLAHPGVQHGYTMPTRDVYDRVAAERDWELVVAMLDRQLPVQAGAREH